MTFNLYCVCYIWLQRKYLKINFFRFVIGKKNHTDDITHKKLNVCNMKQ